MRDEKPLRVRASVAAKLLGLQGVALRRRAAKGEIPAIRSDTGRWFIPTWWVEEQAGVTPKTTECRCAIYARESSSENKAALASQVDGLRRYATAKGWQIVQVVTEIGSGINDERRKLHRLLAAKDFDVLLVEHKDRLTRFGFRWFVALAPFRIEVVNVAEDKTSDLMEDLVAIITSFCARLYGQRRGRKKTEAAIQALEKKK